MADGWSHMIGHMSLRAALNGIPVMDFVQKTMYQLVGEIARVLGGIARVLGGTARALAVIVQGIAGRGWGAIERETGGIEQDWREED